MKDRHAFDETQLIRLRSLRGLTQAQVAEASGLSRSQIIRLEKGECECSLITAARLARAFMVPVDCLIKVEERLEGSDRQFFHSSELEKWKWAHGLFDNASKVVSVSRKIDSYIQTDEMYLTHNFNHLTNSFAIKKFRAYVEQQRDTFWGHPLRHVMLFPKELLAINEFCTELWRNGLLSALKKTDRPSFLVPIEGYTRLKRRISHRIDKVLHGWDKLSIIDDSAIVFHFDSSTGADIAISYNGAQARAVCTEISHYLSDFLTFDLTGTKNIGRRQQVKCVAQLENAITSLLPRSLSIRDRPIYEDAWQLLNSSKRT